MLVALIDDKINLNYIKHIDKISIYHIVDNVIVELKENVIEGNITHSTICMAILETLIQDIHFLHIQIIDDYNKGGYIGDLISALNFCADKNVGLISLSIGTTKLSDSIYLNPVIKKISDMGVIIVAAHSNKGFLTLPAMLPEVIGVIADVTGKFSDSEICMLDNNEFGIDLISAYSQTNKLEFRRKYLGNSFVVPVVTAFICNMIRAGTAQNVKAIKSTLKNILANFNDSYLEHFWNCNHELLEPTPYILLNLNKNHEFTYTSVIELLNYLSFTYRTEALCITDSKKDDIRVHNIYNKYEKLQKKIDNNFYANIDLVFVWFENNKTPRNIEIDDEITYEDNCLLYITSEGKKIKKKICNIEINIIADIIMDSYDIID